MRSWRTAARGKTRFLGWTRAASSAQSSAWASLLLSPSRPLADVGNGLSLFDRIVAGPLGGVNGTRAARPPARARYKVLKPDACRKSSNLRPFYARRRHKLLDTITIQGGMKTAHHAERLPFGKQFGRGDAWPVPSAAA